MKAVVLAAGEGKRMHPLTQTRPKVMLPVANKPWLEHLLSQLSKAGVKEFIFVVGYHSDTVRDYFGGGERWGVSIKYVTQRKQMGSGHALLMAEALVGGRFLVVNGDVLATEGDMKRLLSHENIAMSLFEMEEVAGLGVVELAGDRVVRLHEKPAHPPTHLVNAGIYLLTRDVFKDAARMSVSVRGEYEITDLLRSLIEGGAPVSFEKLQRWLHATYPWELLDANETLMGEADFERHGEIESQAVIKGKVGLGRGSTIRSGAYIVGPVLIGDNCDIGPNCYIRPCTTVGDGCHIGSAVEVKNSIVMKGSKIPHHSYVGDSLIGEDCNLGAGTKIANLRFDRRAVEIDGRETERQKLGAILGDDVRTGINCSINVGSLIGSGSLIGPGAVVSGVLRPNTIVL
ncbi:MAG: Nucleotidyl transferase [Dehalococcoidia bacterium]|nr:Nucleotidyl transferase [Dehalococcoidia bacterium]